MGSQEASSWPGGWREPCFQPWSWARSWIGIAQGFGLYYRHLAAEAATSRAAIATVFGAGAAVGVIAPSLAGWAEGLGAPLFAGTVLLAALAHVAALTLALAPSHSVLVMEAPPGPVVRSWRIAIAPTALGSLAWFSMAALMGAGPLALAACGASGSLIIGAVSWDVIAMYAPALALRCSLTSAGPDAVAGIGLALLAGGWMSVAVLPRRIGAVVSLALVGAGWALAAVCATEMLHQEGRPARGGCSRFTTPAFF